MTQPRAIAIQPATAARWPDLLELSGERGAYSGCWCMWLRRRNAEWLEAGNAGNRDGLKRLVDAERVPGLIAYVDAKPVGWTSVAPRPEYERISGDRAAAVDGAPDAPVWSVVCFYIDRHHRGTGVATALLDAAIEHARAGGAQILEAYPVEPEGRTDNASAFTGRRSMFERAGFVETGRFDRWAAIPEASDENPPAVRRAPGRPVMQLALKRPDAT